MLHGVHNSNNSIHSRIMFQYEFVRALVGVWILEFLLKYTIKTLIVRTNIKTYM